MADPSVITTGLAWCGARMSLKHWERVTRCSVRSRLPWIRTASSIRESSVWGAPSPAGERVRRSARREHHLAHARAGLEPSMGVSRPLEGKRRIDDRAHHAGFDKAAKRCNEALQRTRLLPPVEEVEAEHPLVLVHHPVRLPPPHGGEGEGRHHAQRRRQIATITRAHLRGAERDDAAARPEDAPVATQGRRPEGVEDDVHTLAAG